MFYTGDDAAWDDAQFVGSFTDTDGVAGVCASAKARDDACG